MATFESEISDQRTEIRETGRMSDAREGTEIGAHEAGCGDAVLSAGGEGEESDQWTAAGGATYAVSTGGGDRGEDGG